MVKIVLVFFVLLNIANSKNIYEKNCVACHNNLPISIDKFFYKYLLEYSSEKNVKKNMFEYLTNPNEDKSVMGKAFIKRFNIKEKTHLSDDEVKEAIDIYWEKYKVFGKLE